MTAVLDRGLVVRVQATDSTFGKLYWYLFAQVAYIAGELAKHLFGPPIGL